MRVVRVGLEDPLLELLSPHHDVTDPVADEFALVLAVDVGSLQTKVATLGLVGPDHAEVRVEDEDANRRVRERIVDDCAASSFCTTVRWFSSEACHPTNPPFLKQVVWVSEPPKVINQLRELLA